MCIDNLCWNSNKIVLYISIDISIQRNKCYCFDDLRQLLPLDARKCNIPCPGSSSEVCGGRHAVSVYSIGGVKGYKGTLRGYFRTY